jgi:diaminopropionate ammonia-lyase
MVCGADYFMTISDGDAVAAMRVLALGNESDLPVVSGESGAAGLAGLLELASHPEQAASAGLGPDARVLLISTEGATAPAAYHALVGQSDVQVLARQRSFSVGSAATASP